MNAVAKIEPASAPKRSRAVAKPQEVAAPIADYNQGLLHVIARAISDPTIPIEKMERLLDMQERIHMRDAEQAFNVAMNAAQAEMRPIAEDASNPQTRSKYASFAALDRAVRPIYTMHGFAMSFDEAECDKPDYLRMVCHVSHVGGFTRTYHRDMPADGKGVKGNDVMTKTHAAGSAGSYGMRYILRGVWNLAVGADDDDGNAAGNRGNYQEEPRQPVAISKAQHDELLKLIKESGADAVRFDAFLRSRNCIGPDQTLADLPPQHFDGTKKALQIKLNDARKNAANEGEVKWAP